MGNPYPMERVDREARERAERGHINCFCQDCLVREKVEYDIAVSREISTARTATPQHARLERDTTCGNENGAEIDKNLAPSLIKNAVTECKSGIAKCIENAERTKQETKKVLF